MGHAAEVFLPGTLPSDDLCCRSPSFHSSNKYSARKGGIKSEVNQESPQKSFEGGHAKFPDAYQFKWPIRYFRERPASNQR